MHRWKRYNDFGNQMATFHPFAVSLDLNMDQYTESAWKRDPTTASTTKR
jgi:hypothetical protein